MSQISTITPCRALAVLVPLVLLGFMLVGCEIADPELPRFETRVALPLGEERLDIAEIVDRIAPDTQLVGITHMFLHEWPHIRELAERIRAHRPDAVIVLGGENATAF